MWSNLSKLNKDELNLAELRTNVLAKQLPEHIALIMDGNGRWAQKRDLPRTAGHEKGVERLKETVKIVSELGINHLTVFAFSTENWKRPEEEVNFLMSLFNRTFESDARELHREEVKIRVLGRREGLPTDIRKKIREIWEMTKDNQGLNLNIALNYGGRAEIIDAVKELAVKVKSGVIEPQEITEANFAQELYTQQLPDPELLIRPSGELRISNFLLWQLAYAEFYFTSTLWPDFCEKDLLLAIADYQARERRFGGLKD
ncbi:isoprenyl transferase [Fuchsiella alkaliacetigena]|uniref:isoprenyl transferase n=1 Tax=Fuchsiella alkaliacetigena TaxID=957042 RepID=UPI00200A2A25|nr:isoprenyl transferase [Fuchsiella alkaliacetigena]MCK8823517.1 isoprenyl transferase [Fuchsiella alkaliacetigena]